MNNIRRFKVLVTQLRIGMFICELDRPWLGTPFLLEGLLIEDEEQINTVTSLCEFVYIDRTVSVGKYFKADTEIKVGNKQSSIFSRHVNKIKSIIKSDSSKRSKLPNNQTVSFFEVLNKIKVTNKAAQTINSKNSDIHQDFLKILSGKQVTVHDSTNHNKENISSLENKSSLTSQIKADFSIFFANLVKWQGNSNKLKFNLDKKAKKINAGESHQQAADNFRITIFETAPPVEKEIVHIFPVYEKSQNVTRGIFEAVAENQEINFNHVTETVNSMLESIERNPDALIWLSKLKQSDNYSYNHALNVSIMIMAFANFMALPKKLTRELGCAGLLQNIGKAKVPHYILNKKEKITEEEFNALKEHVNHAVRLLKVANNISNTIIMTISEHHERIDGSGYPSHLIGKEISMAGQMAGIIDTYCALTTKKVYSDGVYNQLALEKIHALRDVKFSGELIDQLVQFLGIYPVSTLVELNTGEVGVVIQQNNVRRLLPRVMILLNPDKTKNEYPNIVDLIGLPKTPTGEVYQILRSIAPDSYGLNANNYYG